MENDSSSEPKSLTLDKVVGTWSSDETGQPYLRLNSEGAAWGTDGCNGIGTTYTLNGSTITLSPWISTLRACLGVNPWLRLARSGDIDGDVMTIRDHDGNVIGTLTRSAEDVTIH